MDKKRIGNFLSDLRKEKGLTQESMPGVFTEFLSDSVNDFISKETVSKWERGEALPSIENLQALSRFYGVTMDEILNGEREREDDFRYKYEYFPYDTEWSQRVKNRETYWALKEQETAIEARFNLLLGKLVDNSLSVNEEREFDFICKYFYEVKDFLPDSEMSAMLPEERVAHIKKKPSIAEIKFKIRKQSALMHRASKEEKIWEAYKNFDYHFKMDYIDDLCQAVISRGDERRLWIKRIEACPDFYKDILLVFVQKNDVVHEDGEEDSNVFLKKFNIIYDKEDLTKKAIKLLIECGARLNDMLLGYIVNDKVKRNILDSLKKGFNQFKAPIKAYMYKDGKKLHYLIKNTKKNREISCFPTPYVIKEEELEPLEEMLSQGQREYVETYDSFVGIDDIQSEEESIRDSVKSDAVDYEVKIIKSTSYSAYNKNRNKEKTMELLADLDNLSLEKIREKYFSITERAEDERLHL